MPANRARHSCGSIVSSHFGQGIGYCLVSVAMTVTYCLIQCSQKTWQQEVLAKRAFSGIWSRQMGQTGQTEGRDVTAKAASEGDMPDSERARRRA